MWADSERPRQTYKSPGCGTGVFKVTRVRLSVFWKQNRAVFTLKPVTNVIRHREYASMRMKDRQERARHRDRDGNQFTQIEPNKGRRSYTGLIQPPLVVGVEWQLQRRA
jgi:hypothetical protein